MSSGRRGTVAALVLAACALGGARAEAVCAPAANAIFPASGLVGTSVTATVTGSALSGATVSVFGDTGLAASVQASSDLSLTLRVDVDAAAVPGERILLLDTPGGSTGVSFTVDPAGGPIVADVSPPLVATQGVPLAVTMTGTNLGTVMAADFSVSGAGVSVGSATASPDGTSVALGFTVDATAELGTHAVVLATAAGSAVLQLYVQRPPPTLATAEPAAGEVGSAVLLTLTGANLTGAALVITGNGVAVGDVITPDDATLTATLTIDGATAPAAEPRLLIVTTESGQTTTEFFIVAPGVPTVTGIRPGAGEPGTTVPVTLRGLNLSGASVTEASAAISVDNVMPLDDETITLEVIVDPGAAPGPQTLTVHVGPDTATASFQVVAAGFPFIGALRPPFGNRGSTITLFVDGINLSDVVPGSGIDLSGPKIVESNAAAVDDQTARAIVEIDPNANVGYRDLTVTLNDAKTAFLNAAFRVNVPGQVPSIGDVSPTLVEPGVTTPITVTGSNFGGGAVLVTGPGVTIANSVVDGSGTLITFDLTLAADAPAENRAVIVVTKNGTARCGIGSNPSPPTLLAAKLVKTGAAFVVADPRFRLFVFEFSLSELFQPGPRTWPIADLDGMLVLSRLDTVNVERAFRAGHRGFVRVRAVTPTNRIALSGAQPIRR